MSAAPPPPPPEGSPSTPSLATSDSITNDSPDESKTDRDFAESLWNKFDDVFNVITLGRRDCKDFQTYLMDRSKIEEEYSKALSKIGKQEKFEVEGALVPFWTNTCDGTNIMAEMHSTFSELTLEIGVSMQSLVEDLKIEKTKAQVQYNTLTKEKSKRVSIHTKAKKSYYEAVSQAETACLNLAQARNENSVPDKTLAKLEKAHKEYVAKVDTTHQAYQQSVDALRSAEEDFDSQTAILLRKLETAETNRLNNLSNFMQSFAGKHDAIENSLDDVGSRLHKSADEADCKADIQAFINVRCTGAKMEDHVRYEPCRSEVIGHMIQNTELKNAPPSEAVPPSPTAHLRLTGPAVPRASRASVLLGDSTVPLITASDVTKKCRALYEYQSEDPEDLSFQAGDMITTYSFKEDEDWWVGTLGEKSGIFPKVYVELLPDDSADELGNMPNPLEKQATGLYDFTGKDDDELSFKKGDVLEITGEIEGWFVGKVAGSDKLGIFPGNHVELHP